MNQKKSDKVVWVDIETERWNQILEVLLKDRWKLLYRYPGFDAGIDFDLIVLKKSGRMAYLGWDNYGEGELEIDEEGRHWLENKLNIEFKSGVAENLQPRIVKMFYKK